jgi:hypothetical protein
MRTNDARFERWIATKSVFDWSSGYDTEMLVDKVFSADIMSVSMPLKCRAKHCETIVAIAREVQYGKGLLVLRVTRDLGAMKDVLDPAWLVQTGSK